MDISFYLLIIVVCLVFLLAMWACAGANTPKWGHDLTLELPPHLLHEALFRSQVTSPTKTEGYKASPIPSAPSDLPGDPLLSNEHPVAMSSPPVQVHRPPVLMNMDTAIKVLPSQYVPRHKLRPVFSTFTTEEPA